MSFDGMGFRLIRQGLLTCLQSPLLSSCQVVDHAFSTRLGGLSSGPMATLNTAFHTGDRPDRVLENRRLLLQPWGYRPEELVAGAQVHSDAIITVTAEDRGRGAAPGTFLAEADALVTAEPGVLLTAYAADCTLLFLVDPHLPVIALAHAGWRGTLSALACSAVNFLRMHYDVEPHRLLAAVSPGVCPACYRVDDETAALFKQAGWGEEPYLKTDDQGCHHLDLSRINAAQLVEAGLAPFNLAENSWCTSCRPDLFFSYRRDRGATGRMMGFLAIRPERSESF